VAWAISEGGVDQSQLGWPNNPLDCGQPWPGSYPLNSDGVQNYPSITAGYGAAWQNLDVGDYGYAEITAAYQANASTLEICQAIGESQWGSFRTDQWVVYSTDQIEYIIGLAQPFVEEYWNQPPPPPPPDPLNFIYLVRDTVNTKGVWGIPCDWEERWSVQSQPDLETFIANGQAQIVSGYSQKQIETAPLRTGESLIELDSDLLDTVFGGL
jgi:hypothetical protein